MIDFFKGLDSAVNFLNDKKKADRIVELLRYAIIAEAKFNKDLADVICRTNANKIAQSAPNLFNEFSIMTSEVLISIGVPAHEILLDDKAPIDEDIIELDHSSAKKSLFKKKKPSELYEFYIRKCRLLKALHDGTRLTSTKISLQKRCQNIRLATTIFIRKYFFWNKDGIGIFKKHSLCKKNQPYCTKVDLKLTISNYFLNLITVFFPLIR